MLTNSSHPKILIVDDDANILTVLKIKLSTYGARVVTARNGDDGFTVAVTEMPDVIVTDYSMPGGSGEQLIHRLKSDPVLKDIPVIVLTGRTLPHDANAALSLELGGAVALLTKPFEEAQFLAELQKHISLPNS